MGVKLIKMAFRSLVSKTRLTSSLQFVRHLETPGVVPVSAVKVDKTKPTNDQIADSLNAVPSAPGAVSGVPDEHRVNRRVRIYQPAKMATQSGDFSAGVWLIDYENRQRWKTSAWDGDLREMRCPTCKSNSTQKNRQLSSLKVWVTHAMLMKNFPLLHETHERLMAPIFHGTKELEQTPNSETQLSKKSLFPAS